MTNIKTKIHTIRGQQVMLDRDLAELYGVKTEALNQAVKRNKPRFPIDFMFQLNSKEFLNWKSQFVMSKSDTMGLRRAPFAFTEHGILMLSSVLRSKTAVEINIHIMRSFVEIRKLAIIYPEYELIREKVRRIESDIKVIYTNQIVEQNLSNTKLTQLSKEVMRLTEVLDHFQDTHVIIKRPNEREQKG